MRRRPAVVIAAAVIGAALFAYAVRKAGVGEIVDGIRRVGWGLVLILLIAGARFLLRAECWRWCLPPGIVFPYRRALTAFLAGDAVGNVTPLGLLASEPTKVLLTRHHLAPRESVASLAVENLVYATSVLAVIGAGSFCWRPPCRCRASGSRRSSARSRRWSSPPSSRRARCAAPGMRDAARVRSGASGSPRCAMTCCASGGHPRRLWRVFALDLGFHALAVLEVYVTLLWLLGDRSPTIVQSIIFEALNRVITVVFKFVPFRVGVDEASAGALAPILSVNPAAGVALAVVRKVRNLFWAAIGLALVAAHPAPEPSAASR